MRVLVVDDSAPVRERVAGRLRDAGLDVVGVADNTPAAVAMVRQLRPDAIVLDVLLRDRHGLDVLSALRCEAPRAFIVILTNAPHYRRHCIDLGADHVLDKSADFDEVALLLRAAPPQP